MKRLCFFLLLTFGIIFNKTHAQTINPYYQSLVDSVSYDSILLHLQQFQNFGVKSMGSQSIKNTGSWLYNKFLSYGYLPVKRDSFITGGQLSYNIIATKTGTLYPNTFVIVCGHYDTQGGTGTNDNGSGVATILEIARIMQNIPTEYSVKFINFSGEESGYLGSQHYVDNIVAPLNLDIRLVFNIDEVGGISGMQNNTVRCEKDNGNPSQNNLTSSHFTDSLTILTQQYSDLSAVITDAYGSDYMPFENDGEYITGFYEDNESTYPHSSGDNLAHLDTSYVFEIAKAACGATLYFARAFDIVTDNTTQSSNNKQTKIFPNPVIDFFNIEVSEKATVSLSDINGKSIFEIKLFKSQKEIINTEQLNKGVYIVHVCNAESQTLETFKILKL